mgnify:FL=1
MIVRIRRHSGKAGGENYYHHADIICNNYREALRACSENRVKNWRWIDTFDTCEKDYVRYEVSYRVSEESARNPQNPIKENK